MNIELPSLPFSFDALEPHISQRTLEFHYNKHHKAYVDKVNKLILGTPFANSKLIEIVETAAHQEEYRELFNNAAQALNHNFFWQCLGKSEPSSTFIKIINESFTSLDEFKKKFSDSALSLFGSGWTWLVQNHDGSLVIMNTMNGDNPLTHDQIPLLTCDVWEHAYYLDYQNNRPKFIMNFWEIVNWEFVEKNLNNHTAPSRASHFSKETISNHKNSFLI